MPLSRFHPLIAEWFHQQVGCPTDVQVQAWPAIQSFEDASIAAPIWLGKKLAVICSWGDRFLVGCGKTILDLYEIDELDMWNHK